MAPIFHTFADVDIPCAKVGSSFGLYQNHCRCRLIFTLDLHECNTTPCPSDVDWVTVRYVLGALLRDVNEPRVDAGPDF